ncbi:hypothetical protein NP233_g12267 [Leucocoprinus birnbaumii]|uniref:Enoyl reductase (ER) domain-containing protein n=1 Tax=Leucocoprinus birnbaumii TaxID=56174 RepID=A0AAD5YN77_9AGAR|nr:hypothetical protein NP233_g12267 [Leucocoprinus birnbaumii]
MQTALMLHEKFGPVTRTSRPIPQTANAGEIIVKIHSSSVNGMDWKIPKYGIIISEYPAVLGYDVAGDVIAVGEGVTKFAVGDKVFGSSLPYADFGAYQSYCRLNSDFAAKIPPSLTYDQACTIPIVFFAAYCGMYNKLPNGMNLTPLIPSGRNKYTNKPILIVGGGSYVGSFAIQCAKHSGFSPIIVTSSLKHTERIKALGVTHVIDRYASTSALRAEVASILSATTGQTPPAEGGLLEYVFDAISAPETQKVAFELVAPGGTLGLDSYVAVPTDQGVIVGNTTGFPHVPANYQLVKSMYDEFSQWLEEGLFKPCNVQVFPGGLDAVQDVLKKMENNELSTEAKPVIRPSETP